MTDEQKAWHAAQCAAYLAEFENWRACAVALEHMLKAVCEQHAPLGIVQARAKTFASLAEKLARKAGDYIRRGTAPTDLCGARVITETHAEVERVSEAIRALFLVDEANSVDVRTRLKDSEFGYLSVHYVVQWKGPDIPPGLAGKKAEIQVRTLLEHAWASIGHDRVYKSSFTVPPHLKRELARVAAFLEEADAQFSGCVAAIDAYKQHYGVYLNEQQLKEEAAILETVLAGEPEASKRPATALRLARLALPAGDWARVAEVLKPYLAVPGSAQPEVLAEHGHALCQLGLLEQGRAEIDRALQTARGAQGPPDAAPKNGETHPSSRDSAAMTCACFSEDVRARALAYRAWAAARVPDNEREARDCYRAAYEADPGNPFTLASYVEYELYCGEPFGFRAVMRPVFLDAIKTCRAYVDAGIELPWAFLTMGRFHLLLEEPWECLEAYCKALRRKAAIWSELDFLRRINRAHELPEAHAWVRDLLLLSRGPLHARAPKHRGFRAPVVILAGGTGRESVGKIDAVRAHLLRAFEGFQGTIISGGTTAGVAGVAGEIAAELQGAAQVIGYLPRVIPVDQTLDPRYTARVSTDGAEFGPREPLQYWADLLASGIAPRDGSVLGIDGGKVSRLEYTMAMALGATVALIEPVALAAAALCLDSDWKNDPALVLLPNDPMTLRAFVSPPRTSLPTEQIDKMAQKIHEDFLASNRYRNPDPVMKPWAELRDDLRDSNRMQAMRAAGFLELVGFEVERAEEAGDPPVLTEDEIERMSEMEHGYWVVQRVRSGWRYAPARDTANKLTPYLVGWDALSDEVKGYDRSAVRAWPEILSAAGFRIVRKMK